MTKEEYTLAAILVPAFDNEGADDDTRQRIAELKAAMCEYEWSHWPQACCA